MEIARGIPEHRADIRGRRRPATGGDEGSVVQGGGAAWRSRRGGDGRNLAAHRQRQQRRVKCWSGPSKLKTLRETVFNFWACHACGHRKKVTFGLGVRDRLGSVQGHGSALYSGDDVGGQALALLLGQSSPAVSGAFGDGYIYLVIRLCSVLVVSPHLRF